MSAISVQHSIGQSTYSWCKHGEHVTQLLSDYLLLMALVIITISDMAAEKNKRVCMRGTICRILPLLVPFLDYTLCVNIFVHKNTICVQQILFSWCAQHLLKAMCSNVHLPSKST